VTAHAAGVDEVVALYDPDDVVGRVTGSAPRSRVRAENLPHAATGVFVRRSDGSVLVHRRADTKDVWPGAHDCASGGVILAGEQPETAARRELAEELGIEPAVLHPLITTWYRDETTHYLAHVYETMWDGDVELRDGEVSTAWWEPQAVLAARMGDPDWPFVPDTRRILRLLFGSTVGASAVTTAPTAQQPVSDSRWPVGAGVVYRFGVQGRTRAARLARIVRHDDEGLLLWVAPGSPTVEQALPDGRGVRDAGLAGLTGPHVRRMGTWWGGGALMLLPLDGHAWSIWWFFDTDGAHTGWYGNLEAPHVLRRTAEGTLLVDTADRALDVVVAPDGTARWKDEDEFEALTGAPGRWSASQAAHIRADGEALVERAGRTAPPFDGRWTTFPSTPEFAALAALPLPTFPPDWDVPHLSAP
jgi:isopentenyldiphosphate isomerase